MPAKAITEIRHLLGQIIARSDEPAVDDLALEALKIAKDEDARTSSEKPSVKNKRVKA